MKLGRAAAEREASNSRCAIRPGILTNAVVRANPEYQIIQSGGLTAAQRTALGLVNGRTPAGAAILHSPAKPALGVKWLPLHGAKLFSACREPRKLADVLALSSIATAPIQIVELILDGVFELEQNSGYVSGLPSFRLLLKSFPLPEVRGQTEALSLAALKYAQMLEIDDLGKLAARLYFHNRLPCTPKWERSVPPSASTEAFIGLSAGSALAQRLDASWLRLAKGSETADGWMFWRSRKKAAGNRKSADFKLYINPRPEHLQDAVIRASPLFSRAHSFKLAADLFGLLRPDKFVVYFSNLDDLMSTAERLDSELEGVPAHPLPFSVPFTPSGLLTWGIDPRDDFPRLPHQKESWRLWVANRLARYLLAAKAGPASDMEPWEFALRRLELDGVELGTFIPSPALWNSGKSCE